MSCEKQNGPDDPAGGGREGVLVWLAAVGLGGLTVCLVAVTVATTLQEAKSAPTEEGWLTTLICYPPRPILLAGTIAGWLVCVCWADLAIRHFARGRAGWAAILLLGAVASGAACHAMVWGACTGADVTDMPLAGHWQARLSLIALAAAWGVWAARSWRGQWLRARAGALQDASARVEACMRRATLPELLASWSAAALSATVICLAVCVPTAWVALAAAYDPGGGVLVPVVLSGSGAALFCVLQCLALAGLLAVVVALARSGWISGGVSVAIGVIAAAAVLLFCLWGVSVSIGDKLAAFDLTTLAWVIAVMVAVVYGATVSRYLLELSRDPRHPRDLGELVRICILAGVVSPILAVVRRVRGTVRPNRAAAAAAVGVIGLVVALLVPTLFPRNQDFLNRIRFFLVAFLVLLTVLLGHLVTPWRARFWQARLAALAVLAAASVLGVLRYNDAMTYARPKVFRYDEIGKHSLRVVEKLLPAGGRKSANPAAWAPPRLGAPPTRRRAILEELGKTRPLTILVILDACRPDRMSIYGYRRKQKPFLPTTPNLDRHKDEFLRFTTAFAPSTSTTCTMRHLFTGRYSSRWMMKTEGIAPFWTNELIRAGYHTFHLNIIGYDYNGISTDAFLRDMPPEMRRNVAALDCAWCTPADKKKEQPQDNPRANPRLLRALKDDRKVIFIECNQQPERQATRHLLQFLAGRRSTRGRGVFAYVHFDVTHSPWPRIEEVEDFGPGQDNRFDESIRFSDVILGEMIDGLQMLGMWDQTLLVVTADHGTILLTGGYHPHHDRIRIPLLVKIPGVRGRQIDSLVSLIDLGPTLMDVFCPEALGRTEGRSLWPLLFGDRQWKGRVLFGLSAFADCYYVVHDNGWHYVRDRGERYEQLYNWRTDPAGERDLTGRDKEATRHTRRLMNWFLYEHGKGRSYTNPFHYRGPP